MQEEKTRQAKEGAGRGREEPVAPVASTSNRGPTELGHQGRGAWGGGYAAPEVTVDGKSAKESEDPSQSEKIRKRSTKAKPAIKMDFPLKKNGDSGRRAGREAGGRRGHGTPVKDTAEAASPSFSSSSSSVSAGAHTCDKKAAFVFGQGSGGSDTGTKRTTVNADTAVDAAEKPQSGAKADGVSNDNDKSDDSDRYDGDGSLGPYVASASTKWHPAMPVYKLPAPGQPSIVPQVYMPVCMSNNLPVCLYVYVYVLVFVCSECLEDLYIGLGTLNNMH